MCKTNVILKSIFLLAFILITIFTGSYVLFWPLLLYLVLLALKDRNIKAIIIDIIILLILLLTKMSTVTRIIITALMITNIIIIYINSYTKSDIEVIKEIINYQDPKNRKRNFYEKNENKVKELCAKKSSMYSIENSELDNKTKRELDNLYLYSKVRFNGYNNKMTSILNKWTMNDLVFLVVSLLILTFLRILWS